MRDHKRSRETDPCHVWPTSAISRERSWLSGVAYDVPSRSLGHPGTSRRLTPAQTSYNMETETI